MVYRGTIHGNVQTGYFDHPLVGFPGQISSIIDPHVVDGYIVEDGNGMLAGRAAKRNNAITIATNTYGEITSPWTIENPAAGDITSGNLASMFEGVIVRDHSMANDDAGNPMYENARIAPVLRAGRIYLESQAAVTAGTQVFLVVKDDSTHGFPIGSFTTSDPGTSDAIAIPNAEWRSPAAAGGIAEAEFKIRS
jgi:hypothetical protein